MRISASPSAGSTTSTSPCTVTHRGRHGGRTSSTTNAARGLARALRYSRVEEKERPLTSMVPSSAS